MKNREKDSRLISLKRKNLMNFSFLTKKQASQVLDFDASENFLMDLGQLTRFRFNNLLTLNLSINMIQSLEPLSQCFMPKLKIILLQGNEIISIKPLKGCDFPDLQNLMLGFSNSFFNQNRQEETMLTQCKFPNLTELAMDCNEIQCLRSLQNYPFGSITLLYFASNRIQTVPENALVNFPHIKMLSFKHNFLRSLKFLSKFIFSQLVYVNLEQNELLQLGQIHRFSMKSLGKIVYSMNNAYCQQKIMKCNWPNAAGFNIVQRQSFQFRRSFFKKIYDKFLANTDENRFLNNINTQ